MRLRLVPQETNIDFFKHARLTFGASVLAMVLSIAVWLGMGLNFGIDFLGGTTIRTESSTPVDVAAYRAALDALDLGDVSITQVFDPTFGPEQNVAMIRIQAQAGQESVTPETVLAVQDALRTVYLAMSFPSVESVGPKVSGELI